MSESPEKKVRHEHQQPPPALVMQPLQVWMAKLLNGYDVTIYNTRFNLEEKRDADALAALRAVAEVRDETYAVFGPQQRHLENIIIHVLREYNLELPKKEPDTFGCKKLLKLEGDEKTAEFVKTLHAIARDLLADTSIEKVCKDYGLEDARKRDFNAKDLAAALLPNVPFETEDNKEAYKDFTVDGKDLKDIMRYLSKALSVQGRVTTGCLADLAFVLHKAFPEAKSFEEMEHLVKTRPETSQLKGPVINECETDGLLACMAALYLAEKSGGNLQMVLTTHEDISTLLYEVASKYECKPAAVKEGHGTTYLVTDALKLVVLDMNLPDDKPKIHTKNVSEGWASYGKVFLELAYRLAVY